MGIFTRASAADADRMAWTPAVDLVTARPVIFALAGSPAGRDQGNAAAMGEFVRLAERPSTEQLLRLAAQSASSDRESAIEQLVNRPWTWLAAAMRLAAEAGDHHLVLAGLWWAVYWTNVLLPRNSTVSALEVLRLSPIAPGPTADILALGLASAARLPDGFVVAGDQSGQVTAGWLASVAPDLLSL
jgi:hypothetical protein